MKDEIKEILDELKDEDNYIEDYGFRYKRIALDDVWHLLDYITNLQDKYERMKENAEILSNGCNELEQKIDKAIELINKHSNYPTYYLTGNIVKDLLSILQGSDE